MKKSVVWLLILLQSVLLLFPGSALASVQYDYILSDNRHLPIPKTYLYEKMISFIYKDDTRTDTLTLSRPQDLFIDGKDQLYIADTGNNRVLKLDADYNLLAIFKNGDWGRLSSPHGVYVAEDESIYIADTGNNRILHIDAAGNLLKTFVKPETDLLDDTVTFDIKKIYVSNTGYLYALKGNHFMTIGAENEFIGFVGSSKVPFSISNMLFQMFASEEQKRRSSAVQSVAYSNFVIDDSGMVYATLDDSSARTGQIRKLNYVDENIFPENAYGEVTITRSMVNSEVVTVSTPSNFTDIFVNDDGIIIACDQTRRTIYLYDQNGNMLTAFGGSGKTKGYFDSVTSVVQNSRGQILVLDGSRNNIQVFSPTDFMNKVFAAILAYESGKYDQAKAAWQEVLTIDSSYTVALNGLGHVLYKEKDYAAAMECFKTAENRADYSKAFTRNQKEYIKENFTLVFILGLVMIAVMVFIIIKIPDFKRNIEKKAFYQ